MKKIQTTTTIKQPIDHIWRYLADISSHVDWMMDAEEITFLTDQTTGQGTTFECITKVGPLRLNDAMTITSWIPNQQMGVEHKGLVTGTGVFTLEKIDEDSTRFTWAENIKFPWWLGGIATGFVARPILTRIWNGNLKRLKAELEKNSH